MKKLLALLVAIGVLGFYACSGGGGEATDEAAEETTEETIEEAPAEEAPAEEMEMEMEMEADGEDLVEHVCADKCSGDEHHYAHGENGHECGDECAGMGSEEEGSEG